MNEKEHICVEGVEEVHLQLIVQFTTMSSDKVAIFGESYNFSHFSTCSEQHGLRFTLGTADLLYDTLRKIIRGRITNRGIFPAYAG